MNKFWKWWLSFAISGALLLGPGCSEQPKKTPSATSQSTANEDKTTPKTEPGVTIVDPTMTIAAGEEEEAVNASETTTPSTPSTSESENKMSVKKESYGKIPDGTAVDLYTLSNANGLKVKIITYGATITDVELPDRNGKLENVALFRDSLADYMDKSTPYFGSTIGRYGNRIAKGKFTLDGKEYTLAQKRPREYPARRSERLR